MPRHSSFKPPAAPTVLEEDLVEVYNLDDSVEQLDKYLDYERKTYLELIDNLYLDVETNSVF